MILLEVGNLAGLVVLLLSIMFGPPILLTIFGISNMKKNRKKAKVFFILAGIYLLVGLGICGAIIS